MKAKMCIIGVIVAAGLGFASTGIHAQTTANGPYYATPSWDQTLPASTRFIVLSNFNSEAVLDRETGLVWEKSPASSSASWLQSIRRCHGVTVGNRMGWRLPSVEELLSLVDLSVPLFPGPVLPSGHPFVGIVGVQEGTFYWTATLIPFPPQVIGIVPTAYAIIFSNGPFPSSADRAAGGRSWCVRGGKGVDPTESTR